MANFRNLLIITILSIALFGSGCRNRDNNALFNMNYLPQEFTLGSGLNSFVGHVVQINNLPTNFSTFLQNSGHTAIDVTSILPHAATISSIDGQDLGYIDEISVRICPVTQGNCTLADEVFQRNDLYRRRQTSINLDPGLANVLDIMSGVRYKLEVVFILADISPYPVDFRLEYSFDALGE